MFRGMSQEVPTGGQPLLKHEQGTCHSSTDAVAAGALWTERLIDCWATTMFEMPDHVKNAASSRKKTPSRRSLVTCCLRRTLSDCQHSC